MAEGNLNGNDGNVDGNADGNNLPAWMAQNPDDLKTNEVLAKNPTVGDLSRAYLDLHGKSENAIQKLGENATDTEKATFWNSIGRPESPEGYKFEEVKMPEGIPYDKEGEFAFRKFAHETGMTSQQAAGLHKWYGDRLVAAHTELEKAGKEIEDKAVETLKEKWGGNYDVNLEMAKRGFDKAGELAGKKDEFVKFMNDSQLGNNSLFIEVFHAIGKAMSEDSSSDTHLGTNAMEIKKDAFGHTEMSFPNTPGME